MYLIIEKSDHNTYAYIESNKQFKKMAEYRNVLTELKPTVLDDECALGSLPNGSYIVFQIEKPKVKKKKKRAT